MKDFISTGRSNNLIPIIDHSGQVGGYKIFERYIYVEFWPYSEHFVLIFYIVKGENQFWVFSKYSELDTFEELINKDINVSYIEKYTPSLMELIINGFERNYREASLVLATNIDAVDYKNHWGVGVIIDKKLPDVLHFKDITVWEGMDRISQAIESLVKECNRAPNGNILRAKKVFGRIIAGGFLSAIGIDAEHIWNAVDSGRKENRLHKIFHNLREGGNNAYTWFERDFRIDPFYISSEKYDALDIRYEDF